MGKKATASKAKDGERSIWKGFLKFGLVSIPVKAISSKTTGRELALHMLHAPCESRIRYEKTCPIHGDVSDDEIVSGYKYGKKGYVIIEPDELSNLRSHSMDTIQITGTVPPDAIDFMYFTDKTYYLLPDGESGARAYVVFHDALEQLNVFGIALVVLFRREQMVAVRALDGILAMTSLTYPDHFKSVSEVAARLPRIKTTGRELEMAKTLIRQFEDDSFDISEYHDPYAERLHKLVEAKAKGKEIEVPEEEEEPVSLDFMEALQKSLAAKNKKHAPVHHKRAHTTRHRKAVG